MFLFFKKKASRKKGMLLSSAEMATLGTFKVKYFAYVTLSRGLHTKSVTHVAYKPY
jgi:hypothetical protein